MVHDNFDSFPVRVVIAMNKRVYSSQGGRICQACDQPVNQCTCRSDAQSPADGGNVRVGRETKGRKGKGVTVITGLPLAGPELAELARELKAQCGAGGKTRNGVIEIQGDHRDRLVAALQARGFTAKKSGG